MCTSISIETADGKHLLARTMDFSFPLEPNPIYIPRNYQWNSSVEGIEFQHIYGFIGAGRKLDETYFVADAVNEKGLAMAELYLPGEVVYAQEGSDQRINLAPHEFILWVLGNFGSISEVEQALGDVRLVEKEAPVLNFVTPLHWILTDDTGKCVVIEPTEDRLKMKENPVGVMTNTPLLEWHIANLNNYLHVRPKQFEAVSFGNYQAHAFSQGTGTAGLPGGFSPPDRFVRAAFFKEHIQPAANEEEGVMNAHHILNTVRIPKGVVVTSEGALDYSQYVGVLCNESRSYYFSSYTQYQISQLSLTAELLASTEVIQFQTDAKQSIQILNP
ncbi:MAG: choloylglycine hydrolase family protein [Kurthia sp.]|nr:choloylglycine hydrolase family protein [Candidatus Kurthia equi]